MSAVIEHTGTLEPLLIRVAATCASLADPLEATAIVESFGYTDHSIQEEFGQPDSRALGALVYAQLAASPEPDAQDADRAREQRRTQLRENVHVLAQTCSLSLIYSMPWIAVFVCERYYPDLMRMPPDAAAPLNVALMASLIFSGGFVQCIARKGQFYMGLSQPKVSAVICRRIWQAGLGTATIAAIIAVGLALYFEIFQPRYLLLAACQFEALTIMWLTCGILWVDRTYWKVPTVFIAGAAAFWGSHRLGQSALTSTLASTGAAMAAALVMLVLRSPFRTGRVGDEGAPQAPRYAVLARSLAPYFSYGLAYFSFVFADRIAAGTAVSTASGMQFAIDSGYKIGMDISLLLFLTSMTAVEYLNYDFMRFWRAEARRWTAIDSAVYHARLRRRYVWSRLSLVAVYATLALVVWLTLGRPESVDNPLARRVMLFGAGGYLLFELALFNALVLFSVNATAAVVRALLPALVINAGVGYVMSNAMGPVWAAAAMAAGAATFLWQSQLPVRQALEQPDYCCYVS